jgi:hypothetical protein
MDNEKQMVTIELPQDLAQIIANKIGENMQEAYYWKVTQEIGNALQKKLESTGFVEKIIDAIYKEMVINEKEFVEKMASEMKESLLKCVSIIAKETVNKVTERIKDSGFIKIGDRY